MMMLAQMRKRRGLSQVDLARKSGVMQQTIAKVEADPRRCPRIDTVYALSVALGCSVYDLYVPDGQPTQEEVDAGLELWADQDLIMPAT